MKGLPGTLQRRAVISPNNQVLLWSLNLARMIRLISHVLVAMEDQATPVAVVVGEGRCMIFGVGAARVDGSSGDKDCGYGGGGGRCSRNSDGLWWYRGCGGGSRTVALVVLMVVMLVLVVLVVAILLLVVVVLVVIVVVASVVIIEVVDGGSDMW
jgi:hypothetical protein